MRRASHTSTSKQYIPNLRRLNPFISIPTDGASAKSMINTVTLSSTRNPPRALLRLLCAVAADIETSSPPIRRTRTAARPTAATRTADLLLGRAHDGAVDLGSEAERAERFAEVRTEGRQVAQHQGLA